MYGFDTKHHKTAAENKLGKLFSKGFNIFEISTKKLFMYCKKKVERTAWSTKILTTKSSKSQKCSKMGNYHCRLFDHKTVYEI